MFNLDLRNAMRKQGLFGYEVTAAIGVSETVFSRKLARSELPQDEKAHIMCAIDKLTVIRNGGGDSDNPEC